MISIVIPAYNEEKRIVSTLTKILTYMQARNLYFEIILVDDGSTVPINTIVKEKSPIRILRHKNRGKGFSVRRGLQEAQGDIICFTDADLSTPIEELNRVIPLMNNYDIVIGSRGLKESNIVVEQPWWRRLPGKIFPKLVNWTLLPEFKDTQCGFKIFTKEAVQTITSKQRVLGWGFDVELLYIAKLHNLKVKELPITWENSADSKLHLVSDSLSMLKDIMQIKKSAKAGLYNNNNHAYYNP